MRVGRRWWLKAAAQSAGSLLPQSDQLGDRLRRWRTGAQLEPDYFLSKWHHVKAHRRAAKGGARRGLAGTRVVEVGTGWFPVVPVGLALHGADVLTVDRAPHLSALETTLTLRMALQLVVDGQIRAPRPQRLAILEQLVAASEDGPLDPTDALARLGIRVRRGDASRIAEVPGVAGADLLVSNNVLEHLPPATLEAVCGGFAAVAAPGARMSHYVDLADHYAGYDPRLSEFHFLTLGGWRWRVANNALHYQNRWRITDYESCYARTGWRLVHARNTRREQATLPARLAMVEPFASMPEGDLLVVKSHQVTELATADGHDR